jgi:hypothetical protein
VNIVTDFINPPISLRCFDFCAYDRNTYEPGGLIGYGRTKEAAVCDLLTQLGEQRETTLELTLRILAENRGRA